ncbi:MAG: hypothetical protein HY901_11725 [Deltaproteobacteria bacterium]|nr:hypothetical protein [Deltaproteobacteria bacterium]
MRPLLFALSVSIVLPGVAMAQGQIVCPYGLIQVDASHCCWPGQGYALERQACAGAPQCPAGLVPFGETCVVASAASQLPAAAPAQPAAVLPPPPPPPVPAYLPPPAQPAPTYVARFEARRGDDFTVLLDNGVTCRTPCEMQVAPGRHKLRFEGAASFGERFNFPAAPSVVKIDKRRGGGVALGVVGLAVGIPVAVVGAIGTATTVAITDGGTADRSLRESASTYKPVFIGMLIGGVTLAVVGPVVGFKLAGRNKAVLEVASSERGDEVAPVQLVGLGASPALGGAMAGATFSF